MHGGYVSLCSTSNIRHNQKYLASEILKIKKRKKRKKIAYYTAKHLRTKKLLVHFHNCYVKSNHFELYLSPCKSQCIQQTISAIICKDNLKWKYFIAISRLIRIFEACKLQKMVIFQNHTFSKLIQATDSSSQIEQKIFLIFTFYSLVHEKVDLKL